MERLKLDLIQLKKSFEYVIEGVWYEHRNSLLDSVF